MDPTLATALIAAAVSGVSLVGSYFGTNKSIDAKLNGTKDRIQHIDEQMRTQMSETRAHREEAVQRLTALETDVSYIKEKVQ